MRDKYYHGSGTLKKSLRLFYVYAIATGAIFTFMAYWDGFFLTTTGPFTFIGFALMMVAVLPIGFVYAEWSVMCPTAGVELVYGTVGLNKHAGFWSTWLILAAWLAVPPAGVLGIVSWINYMFDLNLSVGWIAFISCIVLSLYTILSLQNITISGQVQSFMLIFGIVVCVIGSILWITSDAWSWDNFHPFIQSGLSAHFGIPAAVIGVALLVTPYFGFEIVPNMVEEGDFPIKKQNQAILGSIITCGLLYVFYYFALSGMDTWGNLTGDGTGAAVRLAARLQGPDRQHRLLGRLALDLRHRRRPLPHHHVGAGLLAEQRAHDVRHGPAELPAQGVRQDQPAPPADPAEPAHPGDQPGGHHHDELHHVPAELLHAHGVRGGGVLRDHLGGVDRGRGQAPRLGAPVQDPGRHVHARPEPHHLGRRSPS